MELSKIIDPEIPELKPLEDKSKQITKAAKAQLVPQKEKDDEREFVLTNLYDLVAQGNIAIQDLAKLCNKSEHPRTYEVLANMLKTMAEINKDIIDVATKTQPEAQTNNVTNQNLFVGSTAELAELMEKMKK